MARKPDVVNIWVGRSMAPPFNGKDNGSVFVKQCVKNSEINRKCKANLLRVAVWDQSVICTY